jgi:hypothetical protein
MPTEPSPDFAPPIAGAAPPEPVRAPEYHWYQKMGAVIFIAFCLELGLFLMVFPWTPYWEGNYFASLIPAWTPYWDNLYVRGAVTGLGVVNVYISLTEVFRLRRFSKR